MSRSFEFAVGATPRRHDEQGNEVSHVPPVSRQFTPPREQWSQQDLNEVEKDRQWSQNDDW